jgi:hypothetical protein
MAPMRVRSWRLKLSMNPKIERLNTCASSLWWGEATDEPAREDARPTSRFMVPMRDLEIVEAFHEPFIRKRQRAAALQDASEGHVLPAFRQVLDCAVLWRFGFRRKNGFMAPMRVQFWRLRLFP